MQASGFVHVTSYLCCEERCERQCALNLRHAKDFCLEKCNMPYLVAHANIRTPDRGVWNDELRVTAMIENIAF